MFLGVDGEKFLDTSVKFGDGGLDFEEGLIFCGLLEGCAEGGDAGEAETCACAAEVVSDPFESGEVGGGDGGLEFDELFFEVFEVTGGEGGDGVVCRVCGAGDWG